MNRNYFEIVICILLTLVALIIIIMQIHIVHTPALMTHQALWCVKHENLDSG